MKATADCVGVDYGLRRLAVVSAFDGVLCDVDVGVRPGSCSPLEALHILVDTYCNAMMHRHAAVVAVEAPIVGIRRNVRTGLQMSMVAGAIAASALQGGSSVRLVEPATWKKAVVGSGGATKDDVREYLSQHHPALYQGTQSQDAVDAACLALYAVGELVDEGGMPGDAAGGVLRQ